MTKIEIAREGRAAGIAIAARIAKDHVREIREGADLASRAKVEASAYCADVKQRSTTFYNAFVQGYLAELHNRYNDIPEVQAEQRKLSIEHAAKYMRDRNFDALAKFAERLDGDAQNAFEWADEAINAAAHQCAGKRLLAIIEADGCEAAIEYATNEALNGARWPSHSTSQVSNVAKQALVAAYADFATSFNGR